MALISDIQEDLEDDVDEKYAKKMKVVDQFQRCRIAELQRAQSRSNFAHKNVTFIKSLSLFCDGQHDLSDGDDGDDDVDDNDDNGDDDGDDHEVKPRSKGCWCCNFFQNLCATSFFEVNHRHCEGQPVISILVRMVIVMMMVMMVMMATMIMSLSSDQSGNDEISI